MNDTKTNGDNRLIDYPVSVEVEPKVHLIRGSNRSRFPEANCLLIDDELLTLVDAGADRTHIERALKKLGYTSDDIDQIVLSHFHIDHKGHAEYFYQLTGCEVLCHPLAERGTETFEGMVDYYGIGGHQYFDDWMKLLETRLPHVTSDYHVTGHFSEDKAIDCGEIDLLPIHLPGHTIDHTCFGINGYKTILLVDIDLTRFGPWYGNAVSEIDEFRASINRLIDLEPEIGISSHLIEPVQRNLIERLQEYLQTFDEREENILQNIRQGYDTIDKLMHRPTIYPRIPFEAYYTFEEFMLVKHLEQLEKKGIVQVENGAIRLL